MLFSPIGYLCFRHTGPPWNCAGTESEITGSTEQSCQRDSHLERSHAWTACQPHTRATWTGHALHPRLSKRTFGRCGSTCTMFRRQHICHLLTGYKSISDVGCSLGNVRVLPTALSSWGRRPCSDTQGRSVLFQNRRRGGSQRPAMRLSIPRRRVQPAPSLRGPSTTASARGGGRALLHGGSHRCTNGEARKVTETISQPHCPWE